MPPASAMRPVVASAFEHVARRTFATANPSFVTRPARPNALNQPTLRQAFRRPYASYSDNINPETKAQAKRKGAGLLRWTWRLTKLAAVGALAYVGYGIYEARNPPEQPVPDPSKRTLVILGMYLCSPVAQPFTRLLLVQEPVGAPSPC